MVEVILLSYDESIRYDSDLITCQAAQLLYAKGYTGNCYRLPKKLPKYEAYNRDNIIFLDYLHGKIKDGELIRCYSLDFRYELIRSLYTRERFDPLIIQVVKELKEKAFLYKIPRILSLPDDFKICDSKILTEYNASLNEYREYVQCNNSEVIWK